MVANDHKSLPMVASSHKRLQTIANVTNITHVTNVTDVTMAQ